MSKSIAFAEIGTFEVTDEELESLPPPYKVNFLALLKSRGAPIIGYYSPTVVEGFLVAKENLHNKAATKISWCRAGAEDDRQQGIFLE